METQAQMSVPPIERRWSAPLRAAFQKPNNIFSEEKQYHPDPLQFCTNLPWVIIRHPHRENYDLKILIESDTVVMQVWKWADPNFKTKADFPSPPLPQRVHRVSQTNVCMKLEWDLARNLGNSEMGFSSEDVACVETPWITGGKCDCWPRGSSATHSDHSREANTSQHSCSLELLHRLWTFQVKLNSVWGQELGWPGLVVS